MRNEKVEFDIFSRNDIPYWLIESSWRRPLHLKIWPKVSIKSKNYILFQLYGSFFGIRFRSKDKIRLSISEESFYKN